MLRPDRVTSISTTGYLSSGIGKAESQVHLTVTNDGDLKVEAGRRASIDEEIIAEMDEHARRRLRDALDETL